MAGIATNIRGKSGPAAAAGPGKKIRSINDDLRWAAVLARNAAADGRFVYAAITTGVYCRPSCAARRPRRENVRFYETREEAERAGFRACKRCRPDREAPNRRRAAMIAAACRSLEQSEWPPALESLARKAGLSPYHFHRIFRLMTGVTPKQYAAAARAERLRQRLRDSETITEAVYDCGYGSSGRFYENSGSALGMTPSSFRAGGAGEEIRFAVGKCSLGSVLVAATRRGICAISLGDDPAALVSWLEERFPRAKLIGGDTAFEQVVATVVGLVEAPASPVELPLDVRGTAFQKRVWQALREIPAGTTASYTEVARRIGLPRSVRAVAGACAANLLAVAIPCHRVVRTNGHLSGYRWGVERKRALLKREAEMHHGQARAPQKT